MNTKRLFHGTTKQNYEAIIASNFGGKDKHSWYCSDDSNIYFYDLDKSEEEDEAYRDNNLINYAFESAKITAAVENVFSTGLVVIEMEVPVEFCEDDWSCENMSECATCVDIDHLDISMIKKVHTCENGYMPSLRLLYVSGLLKTNQYINQGNFSNVELEIAKNLELPFIDDLHYSEWETEEKEFIINIT